LSRLRLPGRGSHGQAKPALLMGLAVLAGIASLSVLAGQRGPAAVTPRDASPQTGEPCRSVHRYPVTLVEDAGGRARAVFAFAGGTAQGTLPLSSADVTRLRSYDAYVTDVQIGSYEPSPTDPHHRPECLLNPTYHFLCPGTDTLDQLCFTWINRHRPQASSSRSTN
jgi:hypothetical protein